MNIYFCKRTQGIVILIIMLSISGCAPAPMPPIPPGLFGAGIGWIIVGLFLWGAILLWKNLNSIKNTKTKDFTDAINAINDRLTILEKKMSQLEKDKKQ